MNRKEKQEDKRQQLTIAIDWLERLQMREMFARIYDERAQQIKKLNQQLKELSKRN